MSEHGRIEPMPFNAQLAWDVVQRENRNHTDGTPNELYWQAYLALAKYFSEWSGAKFPLPNQETERAEQAKQFEKLKKTLEHQRD